MPTSPDYPRFVENSTENIRGTLELQEMQPDIEYIIQEQPSRGRIVTYPPEANSGFVKLDLLKKTTYRSTGRKKYAADLSELTGDIEVAARVLAEAGIGPIYIPPARYPERKEESPTEEEKFQDEKLPAVGNPFDVLIKDRNKQKPRR